LLLATAGPATFAGCLPEKYKKATTALMIRDKTLKMVDVCFMLYFFAN
jgi:hypothetical protein